MTKTECCFERPPRERIDDILKNRKHNVEHMHMRYETHRDYLQLCCEIDYLREELSEIIDICRHARNNIAGCMLGNDLPSDAIRNKLAEVIVKAGG